MATRPRTSHLSASHFKTLFKQSLGAPVHACVLRRPVARAEELLLASKQSISQIWLDVGSAHPSHTARCMRRRRGISPSTWTRTD